MQLLPKSFWSFISKTPVVFLSRSPCSRSMLRARTLKLEKGFPAFKGLFSASCLSAKVPYPPATALQICLTNTVSSSGISRASTIRERNPYLHPVSGADYKQMSSTIHSELSWIHYQAAVTDKYVYSKDECSITNPALVDYGIDTSFIPAGVRWVVSWNIQ